MVMLKNGQNGWVGKMEGYEVKDIEVKQAKNNVDWRAYLVRFVSHISVVIVTELECYSFALNLNFFCSLTFVV